MVALTGCNRAENDNIFHGQYFPVSVYSDIVIEEGFLYSGSFPEDGSFEEKENVFALKVRNNSEKDLQLLRIIVTTDEKEMLFEITTLRANMGVIVFEKNASTLSEDEEIISISGENRVDFEEPVSLERETFEITAPDKVFNIKNISDKEIDSDIYVYYKKKDTDGYYFGGITFRSKADGLAAGELKQVPAAHFSAADSEVVFVAYAEEE